MDKETWKRHIEETCSVIRPSHGGDKAKWFNALSEHDAKSCRACQNMAKTMRANRYAKASRALYRDLGMRRVIGSESGSVYYE